jgi:hypothetical protein
MDRASPRAERGSKLVGPVSRIIYGLRIQEDRVGLDWPIKGLGQVDARFNAHGSGPRIPNGSSQYPRERDTRGLYRPGGGGVAETGVDGRRAAAAPSPLRPGATSNSSSAEIRSPPPRALKAKIRLRWARSVPLRRRRQGSARRAGSRRRSRRRRRRQGGVRRRAPGRRGSRPSPLFSIFHHLLFYCLLFSPSHLSSCFLVDPGRQATATETETDATKDGDSTASIQLSLFDLK